MSAQPTEVRSGLNWLVAAVLAIWLALVLLLGADDAFARPAGVPPLPVLLGMTVPLIVFLAAYLGSGAFRAWILTADLPLVTAVQAWRTAGLAFIALAVYGLLPGVFAWPTGLGDIAVGLTAPWVALALVRRPGFATSRLFVGWNLLGILDLVVAPTNAAIHEIATTGAPGEVTMAPMAQLPLVLTIAYFVPLFLMLHLTALFQARRLAVAEGSARRPDQPLRATGSGSRAF
jgi:hypothetical protein